MVDLNLNAVVKGVSLETLSPNIGNQQKIVKPTWRLKFRHEFAPYTGKDNEDSTIVFEDRCEITARLLAEIHFQSKLINIQKLGVDKLEILFGRPQSHTVSIRHDIFVSGFGVHSILEYDAKSFRYEILSTPLMNSMIDSLIGLATGNIDANY